jgi:hypothetical protein
MIKIFFYNYFSFIFHLFYVLKQHLMHLYNTKVNDERIFGLII